MSVNEPDHKDRVADPQGLREPRVHYRNIQCLVNGLIPGERMRIPTAFCSAYVGFFHPQIISSSSDNDVEAVQTSFEEYERAWLRSQTCQSLTMMLSSVPLPKEVTKVVCFGLGELFPEREPSNSRRCTQLAAALTMARVLNQRTGRSIRCYSQEPRYSQVCRKVLGRLGFTVLDGAKGFLEVDNSTLVFTSCPDVPVKQIVTELARPAVIIWNTAVPVEEERTEWELMEWDGEKIMTA